MPVHPLLDQLLQTMDAREPVALATVVTARGEFAPLLGAHALCVPARPADFSLPLPDSLAKTVQADVERALQQGRSRLLSFAGGELEIFVEVQQPPPTLLIVGAGHVARPLAQLGKMTGFEVVVLDDRPRFASRERFPAADRVLAAPFPEALRRWPVDSSTAIVLVTRGHQFDVACLLEVLDSPARYIGMIGSKRRVRAVFELLQREKGIPPQKLRRVRAPIGLDIGAETPAEIAISIIAEIINLYRGGRAPSLSDALRRDRRLSLHPDETHNSTLQPVTR